jgi:hypothetical protein
MAPPALPAVYLPLSTDEKARPNAPIPDEIQRDPTCKVRSWGTGFLCPCIGMEDVSVDCCCAHMFPCSYCTWANAMELQGLTGAERVIAYLFFGALLSNIDHPIAAVANVGTKLGEVNIFLDVREQLANKLGIRNYSRTRSVVYRLCCAPCATCQEVDTVLEKQRCEQARGADPLRYGPWYCCACFKFEPRPARACGVC